MTTLRMFSSRTQNTECVNDQNVSIINDVVHTRRSYDDTIQPLGFHLSDGTLYTYLQGDEYEDIAAAWDWNRASHL